ncbi:exonuclease domain-containing protein [uncultured Roseobacter sp.]|uniref:exonuclease domain-containing protein n=1 Tax=uncultured Roseobacter sp. TaxID=114847 RepID=UPI00262AC7CC|nr:exonuclease domain-containing protein [uncultured Roseobacter sp.]
MFAFYDFETTGTSPAFDQPNQFAAILTDDDFKPIERVNLRCRLSPHILPAPWAMAVTGVTPEQLEDPSLPSWFDFSHQISALIKRWAPATWTGYNTIAFDEEFLRQSFYQNLHPNIYQTQFDHNDRLDLMKVIYAVWDRAPDTLEWPLDDKGRVSFKLDRLAPANGFTAHNAHDALGDVEATIHMATLIRDRAPAVWARCLRNRDKHEVADTLQSGHPVHLIERFGAAPPRSFVGVYAGTNPQNKNAMGFLDLDGCNAAEIVDADDATLMASVSDSPKLIRSVSINKTQNVFPITNPDPAHVSAAKLIAARPDFLERVGKALADRFADREEPEEVEKQIYGGFYSAADKHILQQFEHVGWHHRAELIANLEDHRLRQLGQRLIYWNAPAFVSEHYIEAAHTAIRDRWLSNDPDAPWMTIAGVEKQLDEIDAASALDERHLTALRDFYRKKMRNLPFNTA